MRGALRPLRLSLNELGDTISSCMSNRSATDLSRRSAQGVCRFDVDKLHVHPKPLAAARCEPEMRDKFVVRVTVIPSTK